MTKVVCLSGVPCDSRGAKNVCQRDLVILEMFNAQCDVCHELRDRGHELHIKEVYAQDVKRGRVKAPAGGYFVGKLQDPDKDEDEEEE